MYAALDAAVLLQIYDAILAETSIEAVASVVQTLDRSVQFVCDKCGATRPTLESLRQHTPTCKAVTAKTLPCGSCQRRFRTEDAVAAHIKTAHGPNAPPLKPKLKSNKSRTCRVCQHVFKTIPAREKHEANVHKIKIPLRTKIKTSAHTTESADDAMAIDVDSI